MKAKQLLFIVVFFSLGISIHAQPLCPVIPQPVQAEINTSVFLLHPNTPILISDVQLRPVASYLQKELLQRKGLPLRISSKSNLPAIHLVLSKKGGLAEEGYEVQMSAKGITIMAATRAGAFYGAVSVLQIMEQSQAVNGKLSLPCWNISDAPLYSWRGLMLDESRHFFGKEKVKAILDWMAFYKLNRFHWHLTDEPAWRLEIKKYPLLALVGGVGSYTNPNSVAKFYTQEEIKEIVGYASERQITVIPEIDMPGHATAANRAYPQYSGGGSAKHPEFTFHPGKEETYSYLTDILKETKSLFPGGMLHVGGDEVSFGNEKWLTDPAIKQLMEEKKLAGVKEVEKCFMQRIADSVYQLNARLLVWDEMADGTLPADKTIIFWWRQDQPRQLQTALKKGYPVVLCPRLPLYFDFVQDSTHTVGRKWNQAYNSLQNVYDFRGASLPCIAKANSHQVLGIQANLWTETMPDEQCLDYMLFPRIAALSEAAWVPESNKSYSLFTRKLQTHFPLYKRAGLNYYDPFISIMK